MTTETLTLGQIALLLLFTGMSGVLLAGGLIWGHRKEQEALNERFDKARKEGK